MANLIRPSKSTLAKRNIRTSNEPVTKYLAFTLANETYAAPVSRIREICQLKPLTPVPRAPDTTMGIVNVRGDLVTVIDLRRRLHLPESPPTNKSRLLLVHSIDGEQMGLFVDEVQQTHPLSSSEIEPATTALGGDVANYISGIARPRRTASQNAGAEVEQPPVIILLDLQAILAG